MPDIFLSYNREDQVRAKIFAEAFQREGFDVWWDVGLRTGEAYDQVTEQALREAKAVVVLWSKRSVESRWVRAEATLADRNKTLLPCMIEPCERPIMFELTQTAELSHWQGAAGDRAWIAFVADVRLLVERTPGEPQPAVLRRVAAAPVPKQETTLAVLPFDNLSNDPDMAFFSDGVSEDILGRIQRGSKLRVVGRTTSFQFRGSDKAKAVAALKVTHVLDGSIRRAGGKVRISANLTEAESHTTLWSDMYDRNLDDIFAVQDEISEAIAEALKTSFTPTRTVASISPDLYDVYLRATHDFAWETTELARRIGMLETVTAGAPDFVDGWVRLAQCYLLLFFYTPYAERASTRALAEEACARALALAPDNADAVVVILYDLKDPFGDFLSLERCEAMTAAAPTALSLGVLAKYVEAVGRVRDAAEYSRRGCELDPLHPYTGAYRGHFLFWSGSYAEARAAFERAASLWPNDHIVTAGLIELCAHQKDWTALDALLAAERLARYPLREYDWLVEWIGALRDPTLEPRRLLFERTRVNALRSGHGEVTTFMYMAALGFVDESFDVLDQIKLGPAGAPDDLLGPNAYRALVLFQSAYPELRNDRRFVKICARLGLVEYWLTTGKWPDCADQVPYDFRAECEAHRDFPKDNFFG